MNISINPQAPLPIYAQLMEQIKSLIYSGHISTGSNLPSVRQLAEQLEVNSLTIQKAYKGLEAEGVITIKKGVGAFVKEGAAQQGQEALAVQLDQDIQTAIKSAKSQDVGVDDFCGRVKETWESV
ncbi:MAG: GntR family transcriptional regulator [Pseudobacteriovorax sp.]|nr:GntR family transcriptional regulator [Pseudobacteriovorax sp.]